MPTLNACVQVAPLAKAAGDSAPYLESMAKVAVPVFKLLDALFIILCCTDVVADSVIYKQKAKNKESVANMILVINNLVHMQGEGGTSCFIDIYEEMEGYLHGMAQDLNDIKWKHHGIKAVFSVDEFRNAIQVYRRRVDDLKMDFLIHSVVDCRWEVMKIHCLLKKNAMTQAVVAHSEKFVFRVPKKPAVITAFF